MACFYWNILAIDCAAFIPVVFCGCGQMSLQLKQHLLEGEQMMPTHRSCCYLLDFCPP